MKLLRMFPLAVAQLLLVSPLTLQAYQESEVANGGSIKGKAVFNGRVPVKTIIPTKDAEVCGSMRKEPEILVGPDKGVQEAIVYLANVEKGKAWGESTETPILDQENCRFKPKVQVIPAGNIAIVNSDPVLHNTHGYYGKRTAFNLALPNQGQRIEKPLKRPGIVKVDCDAHGWMLAHIYVADNPYYAVTGEDGTFVIDDVPPGDYTLVVWQSHTGATETPVTVADNATADVTIELGKD